MIRLLTPGTSANGALFEVFRVMALVLIAVAVSYLYGLHWKLQDQLREHMTKAVTGLVAGEETHRE